MIAPPVGKGIVYLVGAGPGDEGLITVRGLELLRRADAVVYDRLVNPALLRHARPGAKLIDAGRWTRKDPLRQPRIHEILARIAGKGHQVVRLKGGDPLIFGRGAEEAQFLWKRNIRYEVVPGPTAASAAAYAGIPLTHRDWSYKVTILTGRRAESIEPINVADVPKDGTLVIYMGVGALETVSRRLIEAGWSPETPAATIEWASRGRQRVVEGVLSNIHSRARGAGIRTPAMTIVGRVVRLRKELAWFESKPLFGRTVVVTRPDDRRLGDLLREQGADVVHMSSIRIDPIRRPKGLSACLKRLSTYDGILFSSRTGVDRFFEELGRAGLDARSLSRARVYVIGPGTAAALGDHGLRADRIAPEYTTRHLAAMIRREKLRGRRLLYPSAQERNPEVAAQLRRDGATVDEISMYRIRATPPAGAARLPRASIVTLTSALTARSFLSRTRRKDLRFVCIGPVTAAAIRKAGARVAAMAARHDIEGLVQAVLRVRRG